MKRSTWIMAGLSVLLFAAMVAAQTNTMDQASEKAVHITQGPNVTNITGNSATIQWKTDKTAANHVKYREAGTGNWQSAYHPGGSTDHSLQLTNLQPGKTYEWQVLTRDGDVRTSGQFQSAATAAGTAPDVNAASAGGGAAAPGAPAPGSPAASTAPKVPIYRFTNSNGSEHIYSASTTPSQRNFKLEGPGFYVLSSPADGTTPLYLLTSTGDAILATSPSETSRGLQNQGVIGYIATSQQPGTQPLYRVVNANGSSHLFTASPQEHASVLQQGMHDEGVVGYVWTQQ